jgi:hypothetical protein
MPEVGSGNHHKTGRFSHFAGSHDSATPTGSTPAGFSMKICFLACTAASNASGRKCCGVTCRITSTSESITCLYASKPTKQFSSAISALSPFF